MKTLFGFYRGYKIGQNLKIGLKLKKFKVRNQINKLKNC